MCRLWWAQISSSDSCSSSQVLDEADRLLTPTFASDLAFLFSQMPEKRQTCLFTATISETILKLSRKPSALGKKPPFFYQARYE